ncbi:hypothetical protein R3W88_025743 [Solanum pinnatisectum]|uniref:Uncharacterized protein n=1 Tax=Solanum pinnatisectum TaxID=50273 RepID=A0AAV9M7C9_9SOLN|nr:hypothetical protein R3W88_025743 [Solanum pinnatisectum]
MSDGFLHSLISRFQCLEVLKIRDCKGIGEIDISNLVSLESIGDRIPQLKMSRESRQLKHSKIVLKCGNNDINATWFCKLRKRLYLQSTAKIKKCFIDHLMHLKNSRHSTPHGSKPRYSQLKDIKAFDGKNQPLELRSGELAIKTLMEGGNVNFLLDW